MSPQSGKATARPVCMQIGAAKGQQIGKENRTKLWPFVAQNCGEMQGKTSDFFLFRILGRLGFTLGSLRAPEGSKKRIWRPKKCPRTVPGGPKGSPRRPKGCQKRHQGGQKGAKEVPKGRSGSILEMKMNRELRSSRILLKKSILQKSYQDLI